MTARGIRNNNPGNIRLGDKWQGMSAKQTDGSFVQFDSMVYGIRALIKTLMTYHQKYGLSTVKEIISRWAPSNENNTAAYIKSVADYLGVESDTVLDLDNDKSIYIELAKAIALHENGAEAKSIDSSLYEDALNMLL